MNTYKTKTKEFETLTLGENGVTLQNKKKEIREVPISELEKIYIKSCRVKPAFQLFFIVSLFLVAFASIAYLPIEIVFLISLISIPSIVKLLHNYKWYLLNVHLKDGTLFRKKVSQKLKYENLSLVDNVRKSCFYYIINSNLSA